MLPCTLLSLSFFLIPSPISFSNRNIISISMYKQIYNKYFLSLQIIKKKTSVQQLEIIAYFSSMTMNTDLVNKHQFVLAVINDSIQ